MSDQPPLVLGETRVTIQEVTRVARSGHKVAFSEAALHRLTKARAVVEKIAAAGTPVYGVTTGLGAAVDTKLDLAQLSTFQRNAISARAVGVGPFLPQDQVRAILCARLAGLAAGGSGISPAVANHLLACLNKSLHPRLPSLGSLGAADLAPLAHMAELVVGEGEVEYQGAIMPAETALAQAGMAPAHLAPKDGLALFNSNAGSVGIAALAVCDALDFLSHWTAVAALSFEAFRANVSPLDPRGLAARPQPGQERVAIYMRRMFEGGELLNPGAARRVQDPLSFRCVAVVHAAALVALESSQTLIEIELNGAGDNPLILADDETSFSTAGFDVTQLALSLEATRLALAQAAQLSFGRIFKLMSPISSDLPRFLAPEGGQRNGYATTQKTAAALEARIRQAAMPVSLGLSWVADGVEDYAPNTMQAAQRLSEQLQDVARLIALEMMVAGDAFELRGIKKIGHGTGAILQWLRARVATLTADRPLGPEIERLGQALLHEKLPRAYGSLAS